VCTPWLTGQQGNFLGDLSEWIKQGKVAVRETFFDGEEAYGQGMESLFTGGNYGKVVVTTGRSKL
jgi:NADPH-dependent curcumin reductase CurA